MKATKKPDANINSIPLESTTSRNAIVIPAVVLNGNPVTVLYDIGSPIEFENDR
jgi:hypothetical protein